MNCLGVNTSKYHIITIKHDNYSFFLRYSFGEETISVVQLQKALLLLPLKLVRNAELANSHTISL
jgi:hypothetical protein